MVLHLSTNTISGRKGRPLQAVLRQLRAPTQPLQLSLTLLWRYRSRARRSMLAKATVGLTKTWVELRGKIVRVWPGQIRATIILHTVKKPMASRCRARNNLVFLHVRHQISSNLVLKEWSRPDAIMRLRKLVRRRPKKLIQKSLHDLAKRNTQT